MDKMNEFIEALKNGRSYDWISSNGHSLNKYELIDIIREYDYAIHDCCSTYEAKEIYEAVAEELYNVYGEVE